MLRKWSLGAWRSRGNTQVNSSLEGRPPSMELSGSLLSNTLIHRQQPQRLSYACSPSGSYLKDLACMPWETWWPAVCGVAQDHGLPLVAVESMLDS